MKEGELSEEKEEMESRRRGEGREGEKRHRERKGASREGLERMVGRERKQGVINRR